MKSRFLIAWLALALGLLTAVGCTGPKVITDFDSSVEFSAFRTFAFSGMTDRGYESGESDNSSLRGRIKEMAASSSPERGSGKSAWKTVPTCWYTFSLA